MAKRILIIDDERDIREVATASLELVGGFEVLQEASGSAGLAAALREGPDAILLDIMMPEMDGYETLRRLKQDERLRSIPVVLLTAKVQASMAKPAEVAGILWKPFDPMLLPGQIATLMGWS